MLNFIPTRENNIFKSLKTKFKISNRLIYIPPVVLFVVLFYISHSQSISSRLASFPVLLKTHLTHVFVIDSSPVLTLGFIFVFLRSFIETFVLRYALGHYPYHFRRSHSHSRPVSFTHHSLTLIRQGTHTLGRQAIYSPKPLIMRIFMNTPIYYFNSLSLSSLFSLHHPLRLTSLLLLFFVDALFLSSFFLLKEDEEGKRRREV